MNKIKRMFLGDNAFLPVNFLFKWNAGDKYEAPAVTDRSTTDRHNEINGLSTDNSLQYFTLAPLYQFIRTAKGYPLIDFNLIEQFKADIQRGDSHPSTLTCTLDFELFTDFKEDNNVLQAIDMGHYHKFLSWLATLVFQHTDPDTKVVHYWEVRFQELKVTDDRLPSTITAILPHLIQPNKSVSYYCELHGNKYKMRKQINEIRDRQPK